MEQLNLRQVQQRLLEIASVVDEICQKHNIPMFMIAGTMLGAVRHKGFIPWDDDMDFAVPYDRYDDLIRILREELPNNMICLTYDLSETYKLPWIKVEDTDSIIIDHSLDLPKEKMPGLTIDIFPLVDCERKSCEKYVKRIQRLITIKRMAYSVSKDKNNKWKNRVKSIIRKLTPLSANDINDRIQKLMDSIEAGNSYSIPVDPNYFNRYFPKQWFEPLTKFDFENTCFYGVAQYDNYLKMIYNNYMELPPEDKRRTHLLDTYLK